MSPPIFVKFISAQTKFLYMIWSDRKILENANIISPFNPANVQPNSYDVTLGDRILVDTKDGWVERDLPYSVNKSEFVLATTKETVNIPNCVVSTIVGKSSVARRGMAIEDAGYIDSGFCGQITLEITNHSERAFPLTPGMKIGQLVFFDSEYSDNLYGSCGNHYQHQVGATPAYSDNFDAAAPEIARDVPQQCCNKNDNSEEHAKFVECLERTKYKLLTLYDYISDLIDNDYTLVKGKMVNAEYRKELLSKLIRDSEDVIRQIKPCKDNLEDINERILHRWGEYQQLRVNR